MDIRVVGESIFDIESDCILYFVDNAFTNKDTLELVEQCGNRILNTFSKISSIPTGDLKIVPAFDLKADYIILSVIPKNIENDEDRHFLKGIFYKIMENFEKYEFNTLAVDIKRLNDSYGKKHCDIFKECLRNLDMDIVIFLCK